MKNKFIINIGILALISAELLAITGKHTTISAKSSPSDNQEICIFCHTPHAGNNDIGGPVPLWNKITNSLQFQMYGATTGGVAGRTIAGTLTDVQPTDQTLACLSCHDGISAMNSVINAPGSGLTGTGVPQANGGVFIGSDSATVMPNTQVMAIGGRMEVIDWVNQVVTLSDGALQNDHPLSIPYIPGRASLKELDAPLFNFFGAEVVGDLVRNGKVHCTSCHDPHGTGNDLYLRNKNIGSALCLGCHDK